MTVSNLEDYFRDSLRRVTRARSVAALEATQHYLVHLLSGFARSENLFLQSVNGAELRPLALMLSDALDEPTGPERNLMLRRLGDVALFIAGFFGDSLARKSVDVDYYSKMGEAAYSTLCDAPASRRDLVLAEVYAELADKFLQFVDALADISQEARVFDERDVLRLYELWIKTGSPRAAELLQKLGIEPSHGSTSARLQ